MSLVHRAVNRRLAVQADSTLTSYQARAHGFVFFLAQVGEGLTAPPRLVKADELDVEVYWQSPNRSKQIILGWRRKIPAHRYCLSSRSPRHCDK